MASFRSINRRTFLRGAGGVALALPYLDAMAGPSSRTNVPMRMVCVGINFGFVPKLFFPTQTGTAYRLPSLIAPLKQHRNDFTIFSQLDHRGDAQGGHGGIHAYLSGVLSKNARGLPEANISLDQKAAQFSGPSTRYPSLQLTPGGGGNNMISWTSAGVAIPPIEKLSTIFAALFHATDPSQRRQIDRRLATHQSILDLVKTDADYLQKNVGRRDREKLSEYFTSIRQVEQQLTQTRAWLEKPKPAVNYALPTAADSLDFVERVPLYYDLIKLALQTDSTRIVTLAIGDLGGNLGGLAITRGYHQLTHHGKVPEYLDELTVIEEFHTAQFSRFLDLLKSVPEPNGKTLFDNTMSLLGSGMGNASSHSNRDLPLLLAGGGFRHGNHLTFEKDKRRQIATPASNLFLSMLQRFGMEVDQFGRSTGTLSGLEIA